MPPLGRVRRSKRTQRRKWTNKLLSNDLSPTRLVSLPYNLLQALHGDDSCPTRTPTTAFCSTNFGCTAFRKVRPKLGVSRPWWARNVQRGCVGDKRERGTREMIRASCHCGAVRLEIDVPPSEVTECNCSICRRYGVLWAYYPLDRVRVLPSDPPTDVYMWNGRTTEFHRCGNCG
jgi:hypothetical protein